MKKFTLRFLSLALVALMAFSFAACKEEEPVDVSKLIGIGYIEEGKIAENDKYVMSFNEDVQAVILTDKATGKIWSSVPEDYLNLPKNKREARVKNYVQSPFLVTYKNSEEGNIAVARSYLLSIAEETFKSEISGNKITISYCLADIGAIIPVSYELLDNGIRISVESDKIVETTEKLYSITLAPYMCSANGGTADSYLFYPSGSGTIVDISDANAVPGTYSTEVYGDDAARKVKEKLTNDKNVYLPVYGIKTGNNALCAIISSGAEQATVDVSVNDTTTGYSNVAATFQLRGHDYNIYKGGYVYYEIGIYSENIIKDQTFAVDFIPLTGENASYVGMAKEYQKYLFKDNKAANVADPAFSLSIAGGLVEQDDILGFPYSKLLTLTKFTDVSVMLDELSSSGVKPNVKLYGFGASGMTIGKVAGGFKFGSKFGSAKQLKEVISAAQPKVSGIYMDFDLVNFNKSGNGYTTLFSTAKTANRQTAFRFYYKKTVQTPEKRDYARFRVLRRDLVVDAANKLIKKVGKYGLTGISFDTLTNTAFSDYNDEQYSMKRNMSTDVAAILETYKKGGYTVAATGANAYAAAAADCVFATPLNSGKNELFSYDVPFYQMVFKGKKPITSEPVNAGETTQKKLLQCLETGTSALYSLYNTYDVELSYSPFKGLYGAMYEDNKEAILDFANKYKDYYKAVENQTIVNHKVITKEIHETTFSNGVKIIVNYSDAPYNAGGKVVKAMDCLIIK